MVTNEEYEKVKNELETLKGIINSYIFESQQAKIKKSEEEVEELKKKLEKVTKEAVEAEKGLKALLDVKPENFGDVSARVKENWELAVKTGVSEGGKAIPLIGPVVGGLLGFGTGAADFATETSIFAFSNTVGKWFGGGDDERFHQELGGQLKETQEQKKKLEEEKEKLEKEQVENKSEIEELKKKIESLRVQQSAQVEVPPKQ